MNERIKMIREFLNLSKAEFARQIKITGNAIGNIESGIRNPSKQTISLICEKFNVNEEWLRTGNGDWFNPEKPITDEDIDPLWQKLIALDEPYQKIALDIIDTLLKNQKSPEN